MSATASASDAEPFDAIVIGAGQAGPGVATHLVGQGKRVALVEMDKVGGTCLNRGCRPTKAFGRRHASPTSPAPQRATASTPGRSPWTSPP